MSDIILQTNNLMKNYGQIRALNNVNIKLRKGRIVGLLGSNGCGKTTLLKSICNLLKPTSGEILINDTPLDLSHNKIIAYLPERTYLNESMKVYECINYFADFYSDFNKEVAYDMLQKLNLNKNAKLKSLSKGTKEKIQLILVMSRKALLYLLDEPIGGVDPAAREYILNTILNNYNENGTILISTHLISEVETILDDCLIIKNGEVILYGEADALRAEHNKSIDELFREVFKC